MQATKTVEDYVKRLYLEEQRTDATLVSMGRLAEAVGVAPGTATAMVKALADASLLVYQPYAGVRLTASGRRLALHILRRHRLIEVLLVDILGMDWADVHEEAEELEHAVSDRLLDHLDRFLGRPHADPHGDPIPDARGRLHVRGKLRKLTDLPAGATGSVVRVTDQSPEFLRTAAGYGLEPGRDLTVMRHDTGADTVQLRVGRRRVILGGGAARRVLVRPA